MSNHRKWRIIIEVIEEIPKVFDDTYEQEDFDSLIKREIDHLLRYYRLNIVSYRADEITEKDKNS